jgi:eukaryotic-like serine/threonine-protein kinase
MPGGDPAPEELMDPDRWNRMSSVFITARDRPSSERAAFLAEVCGDDLALREEVESMLAADAVGSELSLERGILGAFPPGTRLGPYRIHSLIAEGGMGEVYRAERVDGHYTQTVALKVLRPGYRTAEAVRRFRLERQVLARLEHPDIAAILDGGTTQDGRPYLVLQFVDGVPITEFCRLLPVDARLQLLARVARVVQFAHGRLIVHRDLKPSNILVQADGSPRLLDFGIAKLLDPGMEEGLRQATRPDTRLLTPEHAAPEQLLGQPVSTATDVYALGVLLYTLLSGRRPFPVKGRPLSELEVSILEDDPEPPSLVASEPIDRKALSRDLDRITLMALRKEPDRRYTSAGQFAEDLDRYLAGQPVAAEHDTLGYRAGKFIARNRGWVALGAGVGLALLLSLAGALWQGRQIARERDRAERERAAAEDVVGLLTDLFRRADPRVVPGGDTVRVVELLNEAERRVEALADHPDRQARVFRVLGNVRGARGQYDQAEQLLRRAWEWQREQAPVTAEGARTYFELTKVILAHRGVVVGRPMLDTAVALLRVTLGDADSVVAQALRIQALATQDPALRQARLDAAIEVQRRVPGQDSIGIADQLDAEANNLYGKGRYRDAAALFQAALRIVERGLPPGHPDRLTVMGNVATALAATGDLAGADSLAQAVLQITLRLYPGTDGAAYAYSRVATLAASQGRYDQAETAYRNALQILRQVLDPQHDRIYSEMRNLGIVMARRGRITDGLAMVDSAYRRALVKYGPDALNTGYLDGQRGYLLLWLGKKTDAAAALRHADRVIMATAREGHPYRGDINYWMGILAYSEGDFAAAASHMASALETFPEDVPDVDPARAQRACGLGTALARLGRTAEAVPQLRKACPIFDRHAQEQPLLNRWSREVRNQLGVD